MMKQEFEALAGYEVSSKDYDEIIEPMYMATNLSKQEFVKVIDSKRFSIQYKKKQIVKEMKKLANIAKEMCEHTGAYEEKERIEELAKEYAELIGTKYWHINTKHWKNIETACTYYAEVEFDTRDGYTIEALKIA